MGGIPDVVKNGKEGLLVNLEESNDMASKILTLLQNETLRKELEARARSKVLKELNAENMVNRTLRVIESNLFSNYRGAKY